MFCNYVLSIVFDYLTVSDLSLFFLIFCYVSMVILIRRGLCCWVYNLFLYTPGTCVTIFNIRGLPTAKKINPKVAYI